MLDRVKNHLEQTQLIPAGSRILVGYSGGGDSTCLLHLLKTLRIDLVAAHLHHGQRTEADEELEACEAFARSIGADFISGRADVPRMAAELSIGLEEAGRKARYAFFEQAARHYDCSLIATAHTRTDHVETVLHHLIRGSGLSGLAGIPEKRGNIIRPLLPFEREETREYCASQGLAFHDDPANTDLSFSRARIRHRILSEIRCINPSAESAIARTAEIVGAEDKFLNGMAAAALERSEKDVNGELAFLTRHLEVVFSRELLSTLPEVLLRRALRLAVEALGGQLDSHQTLSIVQGIASNEKGSITSVGGAVAVEWSDETIHVRILAGIAPFRFAVTFPGETISEEMGWKITAFQTKASPDPPKRASLEVEMESSAVKGPLYFRSAMPADQMRPLGFQKSRKVSDLMSESHLTYAVRARLPIVCDLLGPLWIPGICTDERTRKVEGAGQVTKLRFEPIVP